MRRLPAGATQERTDRRATDMENDVSRELRFQFGENWQQFVQRIGSRQVEQMRDSILALLPDFHGSKARVLDVGCGSGLASAAFASMGAEVEAFDYDDKSVKCARGLREKLGISRSRWSIRQGSILDAALVADLGRFDVVYAWGVLHHTGDLWRACENAARLTAEGGDLVVAIYNDQKRISAYWSKVKYLYNRSPVLRPVLIAFHAPYLIVARMIVRWFKGQLRMQRGMSYWHDMLDWLGGYPFQVAAPDQVVAFFENRGFALSRQILCGRRHGCNEFVFGKLPETSSPR